VSYIVFLFGTSPLGVALKDEIKLIDPLFVKISLLVGEKDYDWFI